tara:strand:+ start:324 stop:455 length:132 start_codon:yes stop_codon:yes gene_type:complete
VSQSLYVGGVAKPRLIVVVVGDDRLKVKAKKIPTIGTKTQNLG